MISALGVLRFQVETLPPAGKVKSLFLNADGYYGGWFYVTPTGGTVGTSPVNADHVRYAHTGAAFFTSERMPMTPGQYASSRLKMQSAFVASVAVRFDYYDANGLFISSSPTSATWASAAGVERLHGPHLIPANTATGRLVFIPTTAIGAGFDLSEVGVAVRASSSAVVWATDVVYGPTFLNVVGSAMEIDIDRAALDLGTLSAVIRDATMDPLTATTISTGRVCRLSVANASSGAYDIVFEGLVTEFDVKYDAAVLAKNPADPKHCRIVITATDRTRILAGVRRSRGVRDLTDLRETLEDAGVPWSINGNTAHAFNPATVVSVNDNATALDQVVVTRDTRGAHAWMDRQGVLNVWDRARMTAFTNGRFTETPISTGWTLVNTTLTFVGGPTGARTVPATTALATLSTPAQTVRVIPGHDYTVSVQLRPSSATTPRDVRIDLKWYSDAGTLVGTTTGTAIPTVPNVNAFPSVTCLAVNVPKGAATVQAVVSILAGGVASQIWNIDNLTGLNAEVVLDQTLWTDIEIGGGSRQCINEVSIDFLRLIPATGVDPARVEVIPYGPFRNEVSIAQYGVRPAKYTIHSDGTTETTQVATLAAAMLAAAATPKAQATSVTLPVRAQSDLVPTRALGDLQQTARVSFANKSYDELVRITSLRHSIRADAKYKSRWIITYGFEAISTVAVPRLVPEPPGNAVLTLTDTPWAVPALSNGWVNVGGTWDTIAYRRVGGIVYLRGRISNPANRAADDFVFTLPVGFRPTLGVTFLVPYGAAAGGGMQVNVLGSASGSVRIVSATTAGSLVSLRGISFPADA